MRTLVSRSTIDAPMRTSVLIAALVVHYTFHLRLTDGRTGLMANPRFAELNVSEAQLERAEQDRVMLLDRTTGTSWKWLMLSWIEKDPRPEQVVDADLGLTAGTDKRVKVRCLQTRCEILAMTANGRESRAALQK